MLAPMRVAQLSVVMGLLLLAVGCGGADESAPTLAFDESGERKAAGAAAFSAGEEASETVTDRLIMRNVRLQVVVQDVEGSVRRLDEMATRLGGYAVESQLSAPEDEDPFGRVSVRVPSERTEEALQEIRQMALRVSSETSTAQDVTEEYVDLSAQLANLQLTQEKLTALMERAEKVEEALSVQRELSSVQGSIERLQGRIQYLESTAATTLITVDLTPEVSSAPLAREGWSPMESAKDAVRGLAIVGQGLVDMGIWLVILSPLWAPVALAIVWWWVRRIRVRRAATGQG